MKYLKKFEYLDAEEDLSSLSEEEIEEKEKEIEGILKKLDLLYQHLSSSEDLISEISTDLVDYNICADDDVQYLQIFGGCEESGHDNIFTEIMRIKEKVEKQYEEWYYIVHPDRKEAQKYNM